MIHIRYLARVARKLDELGLRYAFVGGSIVEFLVDNRGLMEVRPTDDLDVIIEVLTNQRYSDVETKLREAGFQNDMSCGAPICRWMLEDMIIDIMPTDGALIGLNTQWFSAALATAKSVEIDGFSIPLISPVAWIATKLAAFADRGNRDYYGSHDLEDILAVIDGRASIIEEIDDTEVGIRTYVISSIRKLMQSNQFIASLSGHLPSDEASQQRLPELRKKLYGIALLDETETSTTS